MRDLFPEFYSRDDREWRTLWEKATFMLDANVLLTLSALPPASREELFAVIENIQDRIWVPHQAALEYQRNRKNKLAGTVTNLTARCDGVTKNISSAAAALGQLDLEKWDLAEEKADLDKKLSDLDVAVKTVTGKLSQRVEKIQDDADVRARLDRLLFGRIGAPPASVEDLNTLTRDGDARYRDKVAPGFLDAEKEKLEEPTFRFRGLTYQHKFGDLIMWRQVLAYAASKKLTHVVFVTADQKADWWLRDGREILGPHPDLLHEARSSGIEDFHMYTPAQFLSFAKQQSNASVSDKTLHELEDSTETQSTASLNGTLEGVIGGRPETYVPWNRLLHVMRSGRETDFLSWTRSSEDSPRILPWKEIVSPYLLSKFKDLQPANGLFKLLHGEDAIDFFLFRESGDICFAIVDLNAYPHVTWASRIAAKIEAVKASISMKNDASNVMVGKRPNHITLVLPLLDDDIVPVAQMAFREATQNYDSLLRANVSSIILTGSEDGVRDMYAALPQR